MINVVSLKLKFQGEETKSLGILYNAMQRPVGHDQRAYYAALQNSTGSQQTLKMGARDFMGSQCRTHIYLKYSKVTTHNRQKTWFIKVISSHLLFFKWRKYVHGVTNPRVEDG